MALLERFASLDVACMNFNWTMRWSPFELRVASSWLRADSRSVSWPHGLPLGKVLYAVRCLYRNARD